MNVHATFIEHLAYSRKNKSVEIFQFYPTRVYLKSTLSFQNSNLLLHYNGHFLFYSTIYTSIFYIGYTINISQRLSCRLSGQSAISVHNDEHKLYIPRAPAIFIHHILVVNTSYIVVF